MADNFEAVDLSWVKSATDPLEVLRHGLDFLEDPSKINSDNRKMWCNLHVTPAFRGIIVEVGSLEEVTYWARKGHLGSDLWVMTITIMYLSSKILTELQIIIVT